MLPAPEGEVRARAVAMADVLGSAARVGRGTGRVGGGALPLTELEGPVVEVSAPSVTALARRLRANDPPVLARIEDDRLVLDPRTLTAAEAAAAAQAVRRGMASPDS